MFGGRKNVVSKTDSVEIFDLNSEQTERGVKMPFNNDSFTVCVLWVNGLTIFYWTIRQKLL